MATEQELYRGHQIELRERLDTARAAESSRGPGEADKDLLIDGKPVSYGRLPEGQYFLHDYAYDWHDDLIDLAKKYLDYRLQRENAEQK